MSGLKTAIVSYSRSPGGHWGSSLSSNAAMPEPGWKGGSSSETIPPVKNEPEKSNVWALTVKVTGLSLLREIRDLGFGGIGLRLRSWRSHLGVLWGSVITESKESWIMRMGTVRA
ncbi:hypothetical protein F3Y22_tig00110348pilonHSYRG00075 [Hibiscus syriacus]|uniref:Uncharacterized protein n=1 Tax=Hibiscus syriacus TaxID=106335 RepID=A0A6A3AU28_HIBSY|nr:hypothetical protein F3Y22_tig00110348pilonHSYRG00075 [Hibiscus syriacus]